MSPIELTLFRCAKAEQCRDIKCPHHEPHMFERDECKEDMCSRDIMGDMEGIACVECLKDWDK